MHWEGTHLRIEDSHIARNTLDVERGSVDGGGIFVLSGESVSILRSAVEENECRLGEQGGVRRGAGISVSNDAGDLHVEIADSVIARNQIISTFQGSIGGGGIFVGGNAQVQITRTAVVDNDSGGAVGGGLAVDSLSTALDLVLSNVTVSGNHAYASGGISAAGQDLWLRIYSSTITANRGGTTGSTAGISASSGARIELANSIVFGNIMPEGETRPNCTGTLESLGYNIFGPLGECAVNSSSQTDLFEADPQLGPLSGSGGSPPAHSISTGSPAHNAGDPEGCSDHEGLIATDQRGEPRHNGRCDIGAFEAP